MIDIKDIISNAVKFCSDLMKDKNSSISIIEELKTQNSMVHSNFRYFIAREVAGFILYNFGDLIKNIRLYGSTMEYNAGKFSDIDMLIHVHMLNDDIREALKNLNYVLTEEYYSLIGENTDSYTYLMDIHIINDDPDIKHCMSRAYLEHIMFNESVAI